MPCALKYLGPVLLEKISKNDHFHYFGLGHTSPSINILLCQEHVGFRANRMLREQFEEWNSPLFLLLVDFEGAFNKISIDAIWNTLQNFGIPDTFVNLNGELYSFQ